MKRNYQVATRTLQALAIVFPLIVFITLESTAQVGPGGVNSGIVTWVDASDIDGDGITNDQPTDGSVVTSWIDKSGSGNNGTTLTGQQSPTLQSDAASLMGGNPVLNFPGNSVLVFNNIDLRASAMPNATIFTVYMNTQSTGTVTGLWGVDNSGWDRFVYTRYGSLTDGIASQGLVAPNYAAISGSGTQNKIQLFTAVYKHNVSAGSAFYLGGQLVGTFYDGSHLTAAQSNFRLGWDGDDGYFYGNIAELIVYNRKLTDCEILTVNKFLSEKYEQDFNNLSSNYNWPSPVNNDIAVIGVKSDACGSTSYDQATSSLLTLSNATSNSTAGEFLSVAHNAGAIASTTSELPSGQKRRTAREWRVDEDGDLGNVDICFDVTGVGFAVTQAAAYVLLSDADGDFSNATVAATGTTLSGNTICFTGVNLVHGQYYTIAEKTVAPTINTSTITLSAIDEDILTASNTGILVSTLLSGAVIDGNGDATGIAVVGRDATNGTWQFLESGIWWNFDRFGEASTTQSLLLPPTAQIRFTPASNYHGSATFTYRAWDQTSGTAYNIANTTTNGGTTAFSSTTGAASITVTSVNDAPAISSTIGVPGVTFDGANDHITFPNPSISGDYTIEAWVYINQHQTWSRVVDLGNGTASNNIIFGFQGGTNYLFMEAFNGSSGGGLTSPSAVPTGVWKHVASVNNGSGTGYLYIDGVLVASGTQKIPGNIVRNTNYIARSNWTQDAYFKGTMREIRIWDVARTQTQISQNMNSSLLGNETGLKVYYRADEGTGAVLNDDTSNGVNGTFQNGPTWTTYGTPLSNLVAPEDTPTVIPGFQTVDADAGTDNIVFTLSATTGKINVLTNVSGGISSGEVSANNSSNVTITSTVDKINATLSGNGFLYVPASNFSGSDNVSMSLNDNGNTGSGGALSTSYSFSVIVTPVNDPPVISSAAVTNINEDVFYSYTVAATDADASATITYSAPVLPAWLTMNGSTGVLSGTPTNAHVGTHNVTVRASDGSVNTDQQFTITVANVNDAPTVSSTASSSVNEDALYSYTIVASDIDAGAVLAYSAPQLPSWLTFNTSTRVLSGTPTNNEVGTHNVTLKVNDGTAEVDQVFVITVQNTNDAPVVSSTAVTSVNEDAEYTYTVTATDVDAGNVLTYNAPELPSWLTFNTTTRVLSGTPTNAAVGLHNVTLRVSDGTINTDQAFTINVINTNDAPTISSVAITTVDEDASYSYTITASDVDAGSNLVYSAPTLPSWLSFNTSSRVLSGAPTNSEVGTHHVTLRVNDGTVDIDQAFTITVANVNDAPVITSTAVTSVNEDAAYIYVIAASDVDAGNTLTYSAPTFPSWLTFDPNTKTLSGTPANNDVGIHNVTLRIKDGTVSVDQVFTIAVSNTNDVPVMTSTAVTSVSEDAAYNYTIAASDVDAGAILTYSAPVLPSWLTFNASTQMLSGTPGNSDVGVHDVTLRVNDGTTDTDQVFTITVANINDAPSITSSGVTTANEDEAYSYTITATDIDAGTTLTFSAPILPAWLSFNASTQTLSGTPTNDHVGMHKVRLRVSDGTVDADEAFAITVTNTNDAPTVTSTAVITVDEDAPYTYTFEASDVDAGDELMYSAPVLPSWLTFNPTTKIISGTPTNSEVGTHLVTLRATDGSINADQTFTVMVVNVNDAPVIATPAPTAIDEDALYSYTIKASDIDAENTLTFSAPVLPSWLTFNTTTRMLSGIPTNEHVGLHHVILRVTDGTTNVDQIFAVTVANTNDAPVVSSTPGVTVAEDDTYEYTITAADVDAADILTYTAPVLPNWLSFNTVTGKLSGMPANTDVGVHTITLRVNDGTVDVDQTFSVTVSNTNDAPVFSSAPVLVVDEDNSYNYTVTAADDDAGNTLTYSTAAIPAWLSFDHVTQILSGVPTNGDVGTHQVTLRVHDGTESVDQDFIITVANTNDAPTVTSTPTIEATEDESYSYTLVAQDVDQNDMLTYVAVALPSWLSFDPETGILSGTPSNSDIGSHLVTLSASDALENGNQSFTIVVSNANDHPEITSEAVTAVDEDAFYSYTMVVTDVDASDASILSAPTLPAWLNFNAESGALTGTPENNDVGTHDVVLQVNDGTVTVEQRFTVTVANTNDAPIATSSAAAQAKANSNFSYTLTATDEDAGDVLTLAATELPSWLTFNPTSGVLEGTPTNAVAGTTSLTFTITDGTSTIDHGLTITVAANVAPVVDASQTFTIEEKSAMGLEIGQLNAHDEDGDVFTAWTIVGGNTENAFAIDASTGVLTVNNELALDFETNASFTLMITVSDGYVTSAPAGVTVTVNDVMEGLVFYSAFSPNGDGANETWEIDGLETYPNSQLKIFNSDGMELFSNVGYTAQWDGRHNGKEMPLGTYYYLINLNDGSGKKLNGHFMIIK